jgi:hypothetical protein
MYGVAFIAPLTGPQTLPGVTLGDVQPARPHRSQADRLFEGLGEAVTAPAPPGAKRPRHA